MQDLSSVDDSGEASMPLSRLSAIVEKLGFSGVDISVISPFPFNSWFMHFKCVEYKILTPFVKNKMAAKEDFLPDYDYDLVDHEEENKNNQAGGKYATSNC